MSGAYYNEIDDYAAQWLRNLIAAGLIAPGDVDTRSISDVRPADLTGYTQCHFFAGIGGWSAALRLAGWPDDKPIWTGSCPCQPFSDAGVGGGFTDERHLWPHFDYLITQCRPPVVFGEQVASKDALEWIDLVQADMEGKGYAFASVDSCAAGFGAPHIRQRLYWVAETGEFSGVAHAPIAGRGQIGCDAPGDRETGAGRSRDWDGDASPHVQPSRLDGPASPGPVNGFWRDADWLYCRDGKWRPVEPGTFPLAHGIPNRVGRLRAYGNAIVPPQAAEIIRAFMEYRP